MSSHVVFKETRNGKAANLISALKQERSTLAPEIEGQFNRTIMVQSGNVIISNSELDVDFNIPFDDDTEANEAEIIIYNLSNNTINNIITNAKIVIIAGYGKDTGVIFSGFVSAKKTYFNNCDKVTKIYAIDDINLRERNIESVTFAKGTKASSILRHLCEKVNLPIADFTISRDYTYSDEETIDGGLMSNIKRLAGICAVSAYILKSRIYVRPLTKGDNTYFEISVDTGLLEIEEFEETSQNGDFTDKICGYNLKILLQHQLQTGSIVSIRAIGVNGKYRVKSGSHECSGDDFITKAKVVRA